MQSIHIPTDQKVDALCPVCSGAGWVDPSLVCYCGRAGVFYDTKFSVWWCGHDQCKPEKHQHRSAFIGSERGLSHHQHGGLCGDAQFDCWY